jgi:hypothetical protein
MRDERQGCGYARRPSVRQQDEQPPTVIIAIRCAWLASGSPLLHTVLLAIVLCCFIQPFAATGGSVPQTASSLLPPPVATVKHTPLPLLIKASESAQVRIGAIAADRRRPSRYSHTVGSHFESPTHPPRGNFTITIYHTHNQQQHL